MHVSTPKAPGPRGLPLIRNTLDLWTRDPLSALLDRHRRYGDIVRTRVAKTDVFLVSDPEAVRHVLQRNYANYTKGPSYAVLGVVVGEGLLTSEGTHWLRQRRLAQPAFHHRYLEAFAELMVAATEARLATWRPGQVIDIAEEMMRLTFSIVGEALFSADVEDTAEEIGEIVTRALGLFDSFVGLAALLPAFLANPDRIPLPAARRIVQRLDELVLGIIDTRRRDPRPRGDLLQMLMDARDEDGNAMSDRQLKDEVMTLILAGHETTANAMIWTLALLTRHREVEARLVAEHRRVLGDRLPQLGDVAQLPWTAQVVQESLRLYPPAWMIARQAREDDEVGGFHVPAGATVQISPWVLHRHLHHWRDPWRFDPERFGAERCEGRSSWAYLPFGGGARICIGKGFALLEAKLILATLCRRFVLVPQQEHMPTPQPSVTLRPRDGFPVRLVARSSPAAR